MIFCDIPLADDRKITFKSISLIKIVVSVILFIIHIQQNGYIILSVNQIKHVKKRFHGVPGISSDRQEAKAIHVYIVLSQIFHICLEIIFY